MIQTTFFRCNSPKSLPPLSFQIERNKRPPDSVAPHSTNPAAEGRGQDSEPQKNGATGGAAKEDSDDSDDD